MMQRKVEVSVSAIIHATESPSIILGALNETLGIKEDEFEPTTTTGHFGNPIMIYDAMVKGRDARQVMQRFSCMLSDDTADALVGQIAERTVDSRLHLRIDKQVLVRDRRLEIVDAYGDGAKKEGIKIKIHTPIYSRKEIVPAFESMLRGSGRT